MIWIKFFISILLIFFSGKKLSEYGDAISDSTGLGKGFVGVLLLGAITSLPELITTISSVGLLKQVDLAWGNIYGSNLLNLTVIAFCDVIIKDKDFRVFNKNNILTGILAVIITGIGICGISMRKDVVFGNVSMFSIVILATYIFGAYILYLNEKTKKTSLEKRTPLKDRFLYFKFFIHAVIIIGAGINITYTCDEIARITGLNTTFVGSLFLAVATSLPEIVVSVSAVRLGSVAMAYGNILGSNFFNVSIIALSDIFYTSGTKSIFLDASPAHIFTGTVFIVLTGIYLTSMTLEAKKRIFKLGIDSIIIGMGYILTFYYLFNFKH